MSNQGVNWAEVDEQGRIILPPHIANLHGIQPGTRLRIDGDPRNLRLHRSAAHLTKLYIEPTDILQSGLPHLHSQRLVRACRQDERCGFPAHPRRAAFL